MSKTKLPTKLYLPTPSRAVIHVVKPPSPITRGVPGKPHLWRYQDRNFEGVMYGYATFREAKEWLVTHLHTQWKRAKKLKRAVR